MNMLSVEKVAADLKLTEQFLALLDTERQTLASDRVAELAEISRAKQVLLNQLADSFNQYREQPKIGPETPLGQQISRLQQLWQKAQEQNRINGNAITIGLHTTRRILNALTLHEPPSTYNEQGELQGTKLGNDLEA